MEKCQECGYEINHVYCNTCEKAYCLLCNRAKHFESDKFHDHDFFMICEECEEATREIYCQDCEQYFCKRCEKSIHKRGTRVLHQRVPIDRQKERYKMLLNVIFIELDAESGGQGISQTAQFIQDIAKDTKNQLPYTVFVLSHPAVLSKEVDERLMNNPQLKAFNLLSMTEGSLKEFLLVKFEKSAFLNFLILFVKDPQHYKKEEFLEVYPYSQVYFNVNPFNAGTTKFKISKNDKIEKSSILAGINTIGINSGTLGGRKNPQTSSSESRNAQEVKKLQKNENSTWNSKTIIKAIKAPHTHSGCSAGCSAHTEAKENRLSNFLSKEELSQINTQQSCISKHIEEFIRDRAKARKKHNHSRASIGSVKSKKSKKRKSKKNKKSGKNSSSGMGAGGRKAPFPLVHIFNDIFTDHLITPTISFKIQSELRNFGRKGVIQVDYNVFLKHMMQALEMSETHVRNILLRAAYNNIIVITIIQVTQHHLLNFVSLKLELLSLENLIWVVRNLKLDRVTPIEASIVSRIKQTFALKFKGKTWRLIMDEIYDYCLKHKIDHGAQRTGLEHKNSPRGGSSGHNHIKDFNNSIHNLIIQFAESPFVKSQQVAILDLEDMKHLPAEDTIEIDPSNPLWTQFKLYLQEVFDGDLIFFNSSLKENQERLKPLNPALDLPFYNKREPSETENQLIESTTTDNITANIDDTGTQSGLIYSELGSSKANKTGESVAEETPSLMSRNQELLHKGGKAIPGGRHGLTQFVKHFGPKKFSELSYGKLSKLVQMSIDQGFLAYYKTYLVKSDQTKPRTDHISDSEKNSEIQKKKLIEIEHALVECLVEEDNYLPLAQLKKKLNKRLGCKINLAELGFVKLRNLVESFEKVKLESLGDNHFYLQLREEIYQEFLAKNPGAKKKKNVKGKHQAFKPILADLSKDSISLPGGQGKGHKRKESWNFGARNSAGNNFSINNTNLDNPAGGRNLNFSWNNFSAVGLNAKSLKNSLFFERQKFSNNSKILHNNSLGITRDKLDLGLQSTHEFVKGNNHNHSWNNDDRGLALKTTRSNKNFSLVESRRRMRTLSALESYIKRIVRVIIQILAENQFGIEEAKLLKKLLQRLNIDSFNPRIFGCDSFQSFLLNFAENYVDIEISKIKRTRQVGLIIYPKNHRFGYKRDSQAPQPPQFDREISKDGISAKRVNKGGLKLSSEPFQFDSFKDVNSPLQKAPNLPRNHSKPNIRELERREKEVNSNKKATILLPNSWMNVINTSFLDDLPSLGSHRRSMSYIYPTIGEEDTETSKAKKTPQASNVGRTGATGAQQGAGGTQKVGLANSFQYNNSFMEIKEYMECIDLMLPEGKKAVGGEDSKGGLTFMSAGFDEHEHSVFTIHSELSSMVPNALHHSLNQPRMMSYEKQQLQVVTEQEKERSGVLAERAAQTGSAAKEQNQPPKPVPERKEEQEDPKEIQPTAPNKGIRQFDAKANHSLEYYDKIRKSLSMDIKNDRRPQKQAILHPVKAKKKLDRVASLEGQGLDLAKLKIFVDEKQGSEKSPGQGARLVLEKGASDEGSGVGGEVQVGDEKLGTKDFDGRDGGPGEEGACGGHDEGSRQEEGDDALKE